MKFINVKKISYQYPVEVEEDGTQDAGVLALSAVDLQVEAGQFICILGNNGSGKSTLAKHLNALLLPSEGTVWIDGVETSDETYLWQIRSDVGMVFQNPDNQMVTSRVDEEVAFGPENIGISSEEMERCVEEALQIVGMGSYASENPGYLSGGQKQRVAIAGILAMKPKCIVLDESTAMLDPLGRTEIMDTVLKLNREQHITLICITHFMEEAVKADRVFVMHKGSILLQGTPKEVFSQKDQIEKAGLVLPIICQLAEKLREKGMQIPDGIIDEEELYRVLTSGNQRF